ncbi:MAG: hypothetical protein HY040_21825 [Planctomycetes bacterium]|nr:hypothetical protein [Planctomycetota bacterium]
MATASTTAADSGIRKAHDEAIRELERTLGETMPPLIRQGREAFHRDLPELLRAHAGKWVAYSGQQRLGLGARKTELHAQCLNRGLQSDQFLVLRVEPQCAHDTDLPVDV